MSFEIKYDREGQPLPLSKQDMPAELKATTPEPAPEVQVRDNLSQPEESQEDNLPTGLENLLEAQAGDDSSQPDAPEKDSTQEIAKVAKEFKVSQENQRNVKYMRERAELADKLEREKAELARKVQELESRKNNSQPEELDVDLNLGENDLAEGKHISKVAKEIKALKQELNHYKQQSEQLNTQVRLKSQFPDFDAVVSQSNIKALGEQFPEIYNTLNSSTDLYSTAVSAYTMIKKLGISTEPSYNADKAQALKNLAKPRPLQSVVPQQADNPLSRADMFANGLTPELQKQLYREMIEAKNKVY